eukprot:15039538-Alexandrium_andersonii.AAC.1
MLVPLNRSRIMRCEEILKSSSESSITIGSGRPPRMAKTPPGFSASTTAGRRREPLYSGGPVGAR